MSQSEVKEVSTLHSFERFREWFANSLGVNQQRKTAIYLELAQSISLHDPAYWLQLLFAAGIATLGLILNSPAVIIGAMLISPLMGPILASGLALAAGDLLLGLRAVFLLLLSCLGAVLFSALLVWILPFKELTNEILARTQPNMLDLFVALFSGAIGSLAICKEVKGVVTSIPGVSIAVALMPPLCVTGYGLGTALTLNGEAWRVARGGGLLFLTNLVAITFAAMLVFLSLHLVTVMARSSAREWHQQNAESRQAARWLAFFRLGRVFKNIGGLRERILIILLPLILISIPLTQSLSQLRQELVIQQQQNRTKRTISELWRKSFSRLPNGETRSTLDSFESQENNGQLQMSLRVITSQPVTPTERAEFTQQAAIQLGRAPASIHVELLELPTASAALAVRQREVQRLEVPPSLAQLQARLTQGLDTSLRDLRFPPGGDFIGFRSTFGTAGNWQIVLLYYAEQAISPDAQALIAEDVRARCALPGLVVAFEHLPMTQLEFARNQATLTAAHRAALDRIGQWGQEFPALQIELTVNNEPTENSGQVAQRALNVSEYLKGQWHLPSEQFLETQTAGSGRNVQIRLKK